MIFQPERVLLLRQIKKNATFIHGKVLDVGAGSVRRYQKFFKYDSYETLDTDTKNKPDWLASVLDLSLIPNESYDSIICTQVLEHVNQPIKALQEMHKKLKQGGVLLLTIPQTNELHEEPHDYYRYTRFGISYLVQDAGFVLHLIDQRGKFYATINQILIRYWIDRFSLYQRHKFSPLKLFFSGISFFLTYFSIWIDERSKSKASEKHTLGYLLILKK